MIRAKFKVESVTSVAGVAIIDGKPQGIKSAEVVKLSAVYAEDGPNKQWSQYTPNGELTMTMSNPDAFNRLDVGKEYFLDITPDEPVMFASQPKESLEG